MTEEATRIQNELERIDERLAGAPRLEMTALYAAKQALSWALGPMEFQSPYEAITQDTQKATEGCLARSHPTPSLNTFDHCAEPQ